MSVLALNAGSSSLKFGVFSEAIREPLVLGEIDWAAGDRQSARLALRRADGAAAAGCVSVPDDVAAATCAIQTALGPDLKSRSEVQVVGHRVVHGGAEFRSSAIIDSDVKEAIRRHCDLAPLHNPPALDGIAAAEAALPRVPQVAVFDTAFYANLAPEAYLYPVPYEWYEKWGIRRFGFHGTSHQYCARRAAELMGRDLAQLRLISCHLGGGCSATAIRGGVAVSTTSGFGPLDGLMMGTRCGSIDPGIVLHVQRQQGLTHEEVDRALNYGSGLLGLSGLSPDLAQIEGAAAQGNQRARLAFAVFVNQVRSAVGALAATLGGLDGLCFTDRIGEHSAGVRAAVCGGLEFMGIRLDPQRNDCARGDMDIAAPESTVRVLAIHTEEERMVAREALRVAGVQGAAYAR